MQDDSNLSDSRPGTSMAGGSGDPMNPDVEDLYVKYKVNLTNKRTISSNSGIHFDFI